MCPCCRKEVEDEKHFAVCSHPAMELEWEVQATSLLGWLERSKTSPAILRSIQSALDRDTWGQFKVLNLPGPVARAAQEQELIGRGHFLEGKISKAWATAQAEY